MVVSEDAILPAGCPPCRLRRLAREPGSWRMMDCVEAESNVQRRCRLALHAALASGMLLLAVAPLALPQSYSWVELGTSEAAAQGVAGAWVARAGFVVFGLAVLGVCVLRRRSWHPAATTFHVCFGVGMVFVAVYSHAPWESGVPYVEMEDRLHSVFASIVGVSFIFGVATTLVATRPRPRLSMGGDLVALVVSSSVPLLMSTSLWGLFQRLMFLTAALWYASEVQRSSTAHSRE